jgi:hypothetical protein
MLDGGQACIKTAKQNRRSHPASPLKEEEKEYVKTFISSLFLVLLQ